MSEDDLVEEAALVFQEQADGRKVSRLPNGKVVLIGLEAVGRVQGGERWQVKLEHRETFAIARPIERVENPAVLELRPNPPRRNPTQIVMPPAQGDAPEPTHTPSPRPHVMAAPAMPETVVRQGDRVAMFVDGANTDGSCRDAGFFLDFGKAKRYFSGKGTLYGGFYFVADFTQTDPMQMKFLDFLSHNGYVVRRKAVKAIKDEETGETHFKSNVDVEIAVELLNTQDNYDVAFLFSGDSDFERVVDILRSRGKRVYVVSSRGTLSRELAYVADKPTFYVEDHRSHLEREDRQPAP